MKHEEMDDAGEAFCIFIPFILFIPVEPLPLSSSCPLCLRTFVAFFLRETAIADFSRFWYTIDYRAGRRSF